MCAHSSYTILNYNFVIVEEYKYIKTRILLSTKVIELEQYLIDFKLLKLLDKIEYSKLSIDSKLLSKINIFYLFINNTIIILIINIINLNIIYIR
jgi:hypothetical protein